jgi:hypothetical protein
MPTERTTQRGKRVWRWRTVKPWPQIPRMAHPLAERVGQPVRELCRGSNGNALLEFEDGFRTVAPWRAAL